MKNYIKPTFILAGVTPIALSGSDCGIPMKDVEEAFAMLEEPFNPNVLAMYEACEDQREVDWACKFTSVDTQKIIGS